MPRIAPVLAFTAFVLLAALSIAAAAAGPRRVIVPTRADGGKCFDDCTAPAMCRNVRSWDRSQAQCMAIQFVCLRGCPGARVEPGVCVNAHVQPGERCQTESGVF